MMPGRPPRKRSSRLQLACTLIAIAFLVESAHAGPDPHATDIFPKFTRIELIDGEFVFTDPWDRLLAIDPTDWSVRKRYVMEEPRIPPRFRPELETCNLPDSVLRELSSSVGPPRVLLCSEQRAWVASRAYCSEGLEIHAELYSYEKITAALAKHPGVVPECEGIAAADRIDGRLLVAFDRPGYVTISGSGVLIWNPATDNRTRLPPVSELESDSSVFVGVAYDAESDSI